MPQCHWTTQMYLHYTNWHPSPAKSLSKVREFDKRQMINDKRTDHAAEKSCKKRFRLIILII